MERTLVINPGSASKKYGLYSGGRVVLTMAFEATQDGYERCSEIDGQRQTCEPATQDAFDAPIAEVLRLAQEKGCITERTDVSCVAVRVVAPGTFFETHRTIDAAYVAALEQKKSAAPLHIPRTLAEIACVQKELPDVHIVGVSDSAFHNTHPTYAHRYSIPADDAEMYDVYRFGYHGLSVQSATRQTETLLGEMPRNMVVCHIGSGVSVVALKNGVSIDASMGFTPGSGLMMGTRAGDLDPGALIYLLEQKGLSGEAAHHYVQKEGGFKGLIGNGDLRVALDRASKRDVPAKDAIDMFFYQIKKQIGASIAALGGIDALVLTATAAQRNPLVRTLVCSGLETFGIALDLERNDACVNRNGVISASGSSVTVAVICTDEMGEMARAARTIDQ